ncbi:hypothetical protein QDS01_17995 [Acinetobacter nosocomialis]|uniref:hypothetical protein n=1 Tax=Acinetobacter nosocomialis TaxID=106654 RepID=UPI0024474E2C|nr:hypothetical protein [Acinetobacter nosocomialis]MDH2636804.1 hypothetical protein [Acinetobacter nosocomialis]
MKFLTISLACQLLNEMPEDAEIYDSEYQKFFKTNDYSQLFAWSPYLNKWFLWLHPEGEHGAEYWSCSQIMNTAALAEKYMNKYSSDFLKWHYQQSLKLHNLSDSEESRSLYENIYFDETNEAEREAEYRVWQYLTEKLDTSHKREAAKTEQNIFLKREIEELRGECNKLRDQLHRIKCADTIDAYNFAQAFYRRLAKTTDQQLPKELHELGIDAVYIQAMVNTAIGVFEFNRCDDLYDKDKRLEFPILLKTSKEIFEGFGNKIESCSLNGASDSAKINDELNNVAIALSSSLNMTQYISPYESVLKMSSRLQPQELAALKAGDKVYVDFRSLSSTVHLSTGIGTVDRVEDGYVYGRFENGNAFSCPHAVVKPLNTWNNSQNEPV